MSPITSNLVQLKVRGDLHVVGGEKGAELQMGATGGLLLGSNRDLWVRSGGDVAGLSNIVLDGRGIGIGTTVPLAKMDVVSSALLAEQLASIRVSQTNTVKPMVLCQGAVASNVVVVAANGFVGIGTTLPNSALQVEGEMRLRSLMPTVPNTYDIGSNAVRWRSLYLNEKMDIGGFSMSNVATTGRPLVAFKDTTDDTVSGRLLYPVWRTGGVVGGTYLDVERNVASPSNVALVVRNGLNETELARWSPLLYSPTDLRVGVRTTAMNGESAPRGILHVLGGSNTGIVGDTGLVASVLVESSNAAALEGGAIPLVSLQAPFVSGEVPLMEVGETGVVCVGDGIGVAEAVAAHVYLHTSASNTGLAAVSSNVSLWIQQDTQGDLMRLKKENSNIFIVRGDGRVGVGTTLPTVALDVVGDITTTGTLTASNLNVINLNTTDVEILFSEQVSITNTGNDTAFKVVQTGAANMAEFQYGALQDPKTTGMVITSNAWVGIGTVAPTSLLDVAGKILYRNDYATSNPALLPLSSNHPAMVVGVADQNLNNVWHPYVSKGTSWNRLGLFQEILDQIEDRRGLRFLINDINFVGSNILLSGAGLIGANSNSPELYVYRGFTYRFSNVSLYDIAFTSNTGLEYLPVEFGILHDNATSNAAPETRYIAHTGEQIRLTIPMDAVLGSNYRYQWSTDSNIFGNINIV
jgi:hypothetical protein